MLRATLPLPVLGTDRPAGVNERVSRTARSWGAAKELACVVVLELTQAYSLASSSPCKRTLRLEPLFGGDATVAGYHCSSSPSEHISFSPLRTSTFSPSCVQRGVWSEL